MAVVSISSPANSVDKQATREKPGCRRLDIALDAGNLARQPDCRSGPQTKGGVEVPRSIDECIAMDHPETHEACLLQTRKGAEDPPLLAVSELGLEANQIPVLSGEVVLAQLDNRPRSAPGRRILETDRLHWPESQGFAAPLSHDLDRQAPLEVLNFEIFEVLEGNLLRPQQSIDKSLHRPRVRAAH